MQVVVAASLALAGCNQLYGLDATQLRDAPGPDAPYRCTDEPPDFRSRPVPIITGVDDTRFYSIALDRHLAVGNRVGALVEGPGDSSMMTSALLMPPPPGTIGSPRMSPEGDELFVRYAPSPAQATIHRYARADGKWVHAAQLVTIATNSPDLSIPTRRDAGPRRMLILYSVNELREMVETAPDQWQDAGAPYRPADLGTLAITFPNLTADGLHLIFQGQDSVDLTLMYASRARVEDRFGTAKPANPFFGNPRIYDPYLVEDCSRMYFFVVAQPSGVFYVER